MAGIVIGYTLAILVQHFSGTYQQQEKLIQETSQRPTNIQLNYSSSTPDVTQQASYLYQGGDDDTGRPRILCWIMTGPKSHGTKAKHVKATWGQRCDKLLFISSKEDLSLPTVVLNNTREGREFLWQKTMGAFRYVYENHLNDADWFLKADDDTYVIMENLRFMLRSFNTSRPIWLGCKFKKEASDGNVVMSGGAGYVLSREAVTRFVRKGLTDTNNTVCKTTIEGAGGEDQELGRCLQNLGVDHGDTRDSGGRHRFMMYSPEAHMLPRPDDIFNNWWHDNSFYQPVVDGIGCCSDSAVSFHRVSPAQMYVMEYLIYHLRIQHQHQQQQQPQLALDKQGAL